MAAARIAAIIPARMGSSRFPGKPLLNVRGLPMVEHVRRRTELCGRFTDVVVATCDREIADVIERHGGRCIMTSPAHPGATDRVAEAAAGLACTHVVNVQGDELLVLPEDLERLAQAIEAEPQVDIWNAVARIERDEDLSDPSIVKGLVTTSGRVLNCARDAVALTQGTDPGDAAVRKILGIIGYRREFLLRYGMLARTPLEQASGIDQLRVIEHDIPLRTVEFDRGYPGINEPREVPVVEAYLKEDPAQQAVLEQVLAAA